MITRLAHRAGPHTPLLEPAEWDALKHICRRNAASSPPLLDDPLSGWWSGRAARGLCRGGDAVRDPDRRGGFLEIIPALAAVGGA